MPRPLPLFALLLGASFLATTPAAAAPGRAPEPATPPGQVVLEVGWAGPGGDLGDDFSPAISELGFGARDGLELGFRWRHHFSTHWSLSPGFHVVDYRNYHSTDPDFGDFSVTATSLRYTLEFMWTGGRPGAGTRPFAALAGGWYRNRVVGLNKNLAEPFDESVNTPGLGLRAGLRVHAFEFCALYSVNRFDTYRFFSGDELTAPVSYDWDNVGLRVGWILPIGGD